MSDNLYDIIAIGETLIDFTAEGFNSLGVPLYGANPGGAPANLLTMATILGCKTAFVGKVGKDAFGDYLKRTMDTVGIDTSNLAVSESVPTTLAFVHLNTEGDRSFSFYRKPGADTQLMPHDTEHIPFDRCHFFHFGSVSLTDDPIRTATFYAVEMAKKSGAIITYDPNYRPALWESASEAVEVMRKGLLCSDIVKVSDEELYLLTGITDLKSGMKEILKLGPKLVLVTCGDKGAYYMNKSADGFVNAFSVKTVDTTGAGDAFFGAFLNQIRTLSILHIESLDSALLRQYVMFANAAGGLTTTHKGAIPSMPDRDTINQLIQSKAT